MAACTPSVSAREDGLEVEEEHADSGPHHDCRSGASGVAAARLVIVAVLCALQRLSSPTSAMEAFHAGDRGQLAVAAIASIACFFSGPAWLSPVSGPGFAGATENGGRDERRRESSRNTLQLGLATGTFAPLFLAVRIAPP